MNADPNKESGVMILKKIRFAIIGCGVIAPLHAQAIIKDERASLVAVCDIIEEKALAFARKFNVKDIYTDYQEMMKREDIDAVSICVPSGLHGQCVMACARAGKHVICEKPLDIHAEVMTQMINVVQENKVRMGCIFQNRTLPMLKKAKEILDSGQLGKMVIVECQYRGYRSPAYYKSAGWRGTWAMDGGGCLMNQGIHGVDMMCWLAGDVDSVYAETGHMLRDIEVEDTAHALLTFTNGARGILMGTTLSHAEEVSSAGDLIRIECEKGALVYSGGKTTLYLQDGDSYSSTKVKKIEISADDTAGRASTSSDPAKVADEGHFILVNDMISAIIEDRDPYITGDSARKGVDVVLAIYESSRLGERVSVRHN